ncbi:universal stress protein [Bdellovibrio sp. BCCA]|uniref:universal stress protein n=1 Tax=Bdellovibrio sp. BCCA TaxID=3136281 RepID=UPI0030F0EED1
MAEEFLLIADDIADKSSKGRRRSKLIRENAIELAKKMNLNAEFLFVANLNSKLFKKNEMALFTETFGSAKSSIEKQFKKGQVPLKLKIKYGVPAEEILSEMDRINNAKLLVLGTQGKKGLKKVLLGSVAEEVLRNSPLPTLVIGPIAQEQQAVVKLDENLQIHFLTDLSSSSAEAEKFVIAFCKQFKCSVLIVHSVGEQIMKIRENLYSTGYMPFNIEKVFSQMVDDAQRELQRKTRDWVKQGLKASPLLIDKEQSLEKSLKTLRPSPPGLIVMGTHGRNKIVTSFLGSTARKFLLTSSVPVMVVRSIRD